MTQRTKVSSLDLHVGKRIGLIKDTASRLFNLDVHLGDLQPEKAAIDIQISRSPLARVMEVNTSWSLVRRSHQRAHAATSGNLLVYLIMQGGSSFVNQKGEQFTTHAGSVVIGSQDLAYRAAAAAGRDWRFQVLNVADEALSVSSGRIKQGGFRLLPVQAPMSALLSRYLAHLCHELPLLDVDASAEALRAFDQLLAGALGYADPRQEELAITVTGERRRQALQFMQAQLESRALSPASIACAWPR